MDKKDYSLKPKDYEGGQSLFDANTTITALQSSLKEKEELRNEIDQDFKELNIYFDDLYHHAVIQVKDCGQLWIEFSDKFRAFEKRIKQL